MLSPVLIANRGEIACRIIRTARALGVETVAVHSDPDTDAPHVALADRAVPIGGRTPGESYLDAGKLIEAARASGARSVHPGYGFLSENADFAKAVIDAGLTWIGPPPAAIALMGDKAAARSRMIAAGVPCLPGVEDTGDDAGLAAAARGIELPLMVKAAAGGGGRGMRLVTAEGEIEEAIAAARAEALSAFGSDALIVERALTAARHIEVQVFADAHGTVVSLGERDCSLQRRHQKVIEEAPGPSVTPEMRDALSAAAVEAARAVDYRGAGTVEFLADGDAFWFLEMNTRLQVEHPVTEMVTGLDLVALQFRVAEGLPLGVGPEDVSLDGHAIEARLYAEDPAQGFLPQSGSLERFRPPDGPGVRTDAGVVELQEITPFYDPMIAKIIAHGPDRETARRRLVRALRETVLFGPATNRGFLIDLLEDERFRQGEAMTATIGEHFAEPVAPEPEPADLARAGVILSHAARRAAHRASIGVDPDLLGWSNAPIPIEEDFALADGPCTVTLRTQPGGRYIVTVGETTFGAEVRDMTDISARIALDGVPATVHYLIGADAIRLSVEGRDLTLPRPVPGAAASGSAGAGRIHAPMHGLLVEVIAASGQRVEAGERLLVIEAMKMRHPVDAPVAGKITAIHAAEGDQVAANAVLVEIEED